MMLVFLLGFVLLGLCYVGESEGGKKYNTECDEGDDCPDFEYTHDGGKGDDAGIIFKFKSLQEVDAEGVGVVDTNEDVKEITRLPLGMNEQQTERTGEGYNAEEVYYAGTFNGVCEFIGCDTIEFSARNIFVEEGTMTYEEEGHTDVELPEGVVKTAIVVKYWPFESTNNFLRTTFTIIGKNLEKPIEATTDGTIVTLSSDDGSYVSVDFLGKVIVDDIEYDVTLSVVDEIESQNKIEVTMDFPAGDVINYDPILEVESAHIACFSMLLLLLLFFF